MPDQPIIFFGNEQLATGIESSGVILQSLINEGYNISKIVINKSKITSRKKQPSAVEQIALSNKISMQTSWDEQELIKHIKSKGIKFAVLASYGKIIPESILDLITIINIHPSLLPVYRGSTPIESAILNGTHLTGVSLMKLVKKMDAGPLYAQAKYHFTEDISKQQLFDELSITGSRLLSAHLPKIITGKLKAKEQVGTPSYTAMLSKYDQTIDWANNDATTIARQVRAKLGWPKSITVFNGRTVTLLNVSASENTGQAGEAFSLDDQLGFYCHDGSIIVNSLQLPGKKPISGADYLRGYGLS